MSRLRRRKPRSLGEIVRDYVLLLLLFSIIIIILLLILLLLFDNRRIEISGQARTGANWNGAAERSFKLPLSAAAAHMLRGTVYRFHVLLLCTYQSYRSVFRIYAASPLTTVNYIIFNPFRGHIRLPTYVTQYNM